LVARVTIYSIVLVSIALAISGTALLWSYKASLERILENHLAAYADILIADVRVRNGEVTLDQDAILSRIPRYWQITAKGKNLYKSERLKRWIVPAPEDAREPQRLHETDSDGAEIEAVQMTYVFPDDVPVTLISGLDKKVADADLAEEATRLKSPLYRILFLEGLFLVAASYVLARHSMSPVRAVNAALRAIRRGDEERIRGSYPAEIRELSDEINHLLDYTFAVIARYREFSTNLAHSLRTPITVIRNESDLAIIRDEADRMLNSVERNLARVHAAPSFHPLSANTRVLPVIQDIAQGFGRVYAKSIAIDYPEDVVFKGDKADLYEVLGNIIENACKFSRSRVSICNRDGLIVVEDDGDGIPQSQRADVLRRGTRLDTSKPGSGIGLAIAREIVALYKGDIVLDASVLSGLKVSVRLPIQR
jgi:signal transduction histidine kinase